MATFEKTLEQAFATAQRNALVKVILGNPSLTLQQIAEMARGRHGPMLAHITVGDLRGGGAPTARPRGRAPRVGSADTSTRAARDRYDGALLAALKSSGTWMNAQGLRAAAGGAPLQARKALARLCEKGVVVWKGRARATKYRAAK